jgi:feruloyl esterase
MEQFFYSQNTDLTAFNEAGRKMLLMHSWSDPKVPVGLTLDWYARVRRMMGGQESTDGFLRLFLMPGMWHVWGYVSSTPL